MARKKQPEFEAVDVREHSVTRILERHEELICQILKRIGGVPAEVAETETETCG